MVVYNPPLSSDSRVESSTLKNAVQNHRDEVLKQIIRCPSNSMNILSAFVDLNVSISEFFPLFCMVIL